MRSEQKRPAAIPSERLEPELRWTPDVPATVCYGMLDESATVNADGALRCPHGESHTHDLSGEDA